MINVNLKQIRKNRNLTQTNLADLSGLTKDHISKIERSEIEPRISTLQKIANALKIPLSELITAKSEELV